MRPLELKSGSKAQIVVTLQPFNYAPYYIDLPSNVSTLRVATLNATGDSSLYVKQGTPHQGTTWEALVSESAYVAITASPNEQITATRGSSPGITPGRWWLTPANPTGQAITLTLDVTFEISGAAYALSARQSGTWYDPRKNYQGFFFEMLDATSALVVWFTFTPDGQQAYFVGLGAVSGDRVTIGNLVKTRGGRFGPDFDPAMVVREDWGDLVFTFDGCNSGYASYLPSETAFNQGWPAEQLDMDRITTVSGLACGAAAGTTKYLSGGISGGWYEPARDGEGWLVEILNSTTALVYWFSYTPDGRQAWFGNVGRIVNGSIIVDQALQPVGGRFGPNYNPGQVSVQPWGAFALTMTGCNRAIAAAVGPTNYGSLDYLDVTRLTALAGTDPCAFSTGSFTVSGRVRAPVNTFIDGDVNNPDVPNIENDTPAQKQVIGNPATVAGYAAETPTGEQGDRFATATDVLDAYTVPAAAGQVIKLAIADHEASNPTAIDLDLHLYAASDSSNPIAVSEGSGPIEQIVVPQSGQYDIVVIAYKGRTNYVLTVDNAATAATGVAGALTLAVPMVLDEVIVGMDGPTQTDESSGRARAKAQAEAFGLEYRAGSADRAMLLGLGDAAGRSRAVSKLGIRDKGHVGWRITDPEAMARHEVNLFIKALRAQQGVRSAEPNYIRTMNATPNDPGYRYQWHYPAINLPQAWEFTTGDPQVVVAVVDTGVAPHPEFSGLLRYDLGFDAISQSFRSLDGGGIDRDADDPGDRSSPSGASSFHGTHVAGTIAARSNDGVGVAGATWRSTLMPVRVLGEFGGTEYDIIQGIRWAAGLSNDSGTVPAQRASVINLSLGGLAPGGCPAEYVSVISAARSNGTIVVAAAGNDATTVPFVPAVCAGVVSVSAVGLDNRLAPYSNFGSSIDVAAPGGDVSVDRNADGAPDGVLSTIFDDEGRPRTPSFTVLDGTSMASPHVAGVAALMKAVYPAMTPAQFDSLLASGAITRDLAGNGASVRDDQFGFGLVDALKAVAEARRLSGIQSLPAVTVATPTTLDFGATATAGSVSISNAGQGAASVSGVAATQSWLRVAPAQVDGQGLGTYAVSVERAGLVSASYRGELRFTTSTGPLTVQVGMRVGSPAAAGNLGTQYVLLIDSVTGTTAEGLGVQVGANGEYAFALPPILPNDYFVLVGSDLDNDYIVCDPGESCGAYSSLDQPSRIQLRNSNITLPTFAVVPDVGLLGSSTPAVTISGKAGARGGGRERQRRQ